MKFVAAFASSITLLRFCKAEFLAVAAKFDVEVRPVPGGADWLGGCAEGESENGYDDDPFYVFESDAGFEALRKVAQQCILLRAIHILLQAAPSVKELLAWRLSRDSATTAQQVGDVSIAPSSSSVPASAESRVVVGEDEAAYAKDKYAYRVDAAGKVYRREEKNRIIEAVLKSFPALHGKQVELQKPEQQFLILIQHPAPCGPLESRRRRGSDEEELLILHVVAFLESGRTAMLGKYDLKRRPYLGTTSMPPEESFLMANLAAIDAAQFVYDPFCGTGSLLVAAAHFGASTFASDADARVMRNGTKKCATSPQLQQQRKLAFSTYSAEELSTLTQEERALPTMLTNFKLYDLRAPDCLRVNFSDWQVTWRKLASQPAAATATGLFDAILTDPPYGPREPRKKSLRNLSVEETEKGASSTPTAPPVHYTTDEVVLDLVLFAAEHLTVGGHLAFWLATSDSYTDDELPTHPSMRVVHNIPQRLSLKYVRRLITMKKVAPPPIPRPSRASCAPKKQPEDLRLLMDKTSLPDNKGYTSYREKVEQKRAAVRRYWDHQAVSSGSGVEQDEGTPPPRGGQEGEERRKKRFRGKYSHQVEVVANREKNIRDSESRQQASLIANAARRKHRDNE